MKFPLLMAVVLTVGSVAMPMASLRFAAASTNTFALVVSPRNDSTQPISLEKVAAYQSATVANVWGVAVLDSYAYVVADNAVGEANIAVFAVSTSAAPKPLSHFPLLAGARQIQIGGPFVYVARVTNDHNPATAFEPFQTDPPLHVNLNQVRLTGKYAYVTGDTDALQIVELSQPEAPQLVSALGLPAQRWAAVVAGDYAYMAAGTAGLRVMAVTTQPSSPVIAQIATTGQVQGITVVDDYAYVVGQSGLAVIDIRQPSQPRQVGGVALDGVGQQVVVAGNYAYVAAGLSGLYLVDISNPAQPTVAAQYDTAGDATALAVAGDLIYVADQVAGLLLLRFQLEA